MDEMAIFKKHFPKAVIEPMVFRGLRITTISGFVEYKDDLFTQFVGGPDIYLGVCRCAKDMGWPSIRVSGPEKHIIATMAHASSVGLEVIPEIEQHGYGCLSVLIGLGISGVLMWPGSVLLDGWMLWVAAGLAAGAIMHWLVQPHVDKMAERAARKAGQVYRNALPDVHGHQRFYEP